MKLKTKLQKLHEQGFSEEAEYSIVASDLKRQQDLREKMARKKGFKKPGISSRDKPGFKTTN